MLSAKLEAVQKTLVSSTGTDIGSGDGETFALDDLDDMDFDDVMIDLITTLRNILS